MAKKSRHKRGAKVAKDKLTPADIERGNRYTQARKEAGFSSQTKLAEAITKLVKQKPGGRGKSVTQQAVAAVETGQTRNPWYREAWAMLTNRKEEWLEFGIEDLDAMDPDAVRLLIDFQNLKPEEKALIADLIGTYKERSGNK